MQSGSACAGILESWVGAGACFSHGQFGLNSSLWGRVGTVTRYVLRVEYGVLDH